MARDIQVLQFFSGEGTDSRGRLLKQVLNWSDDELERTHDFIQWLFPLAEPSGFNIHAPVLDDSTIQQFLAEDKFRQSLRAALIRMLTFYGLEFLPGVPPRIIPGQRYAGRSRNWVTLGNHNHLRITRILKSLRLLGLEPEAAAFFDCLADIYGDESVKTSPRISQETFNFWQSAAKN